MTIPHSGSPPQCDEYRSAARPSHDAREHEISAPTRIASERRIPFRLQVGRGSRRGTENTGLNRRPYRSGAVLSVAAVDSRSEVMIDGSAEMLGPFWRPLRSDWAFWPFCLAVAVDCFVRATQTVRSGATAGSVLAQVALGVPFVILGWLVIFSIVIGVPRGFLLGARGGRRVRRKPGTSGSRSDGVNAPESIDAPPMSPARGTPEQ